MITVNVGGVPFCVDGDALHAHLGSFLTDAFDYSGMAPAKAKVIRLGMKMMMRETLGMVERAIIQGRMPGITPPDWTLADKDILTYGASYIFAMALRDIEKQAFDAEYHEGPNGEIILTGLTTAAALPSESLVAGFLPGPDAPEVDAAAGTVDATGQPDTPPVGAATPAGESGGASEYRGESGRYVDAGGDEGHGQDDGGESVNQVVVAALP